MVSFLKDQLESFLKDQVFTIIGINNELEELRKWMVEFRETLMEYEGREMRKEHCILLSRLNEAMQDIEDILQDCRIHAGEDRQAGFGHDQQVSLPLPSLRNVPSDLAVRLKVGSMIRDIKSEIGEVWPEIKQLGKNPAADQGHPYGDGVSDMHPDIGVTDMHPDIVSDDIVGLRYEIADLQKALTSQPDVKMQENVHAITGMAGIGKTALAKMIFNSTEVQNYFNRRIWLHVSKKQWQAPKLLFKSFVDQIDDGSYTEGVTLAHLFKIVGNLVRDKRLLLVLDGCWSADVWKQNLRDPLSKAAEGSAVLITTRNRAVAQEMNAREFVKSPLSHLDGSHLLRNEIRGNLMKDWGGMEEDAIKEVLRKCDGVPLAIKLIGGVLKRKEQRHWNDILSGDVWNYDSGEIWNDDSLPKYIMPALIQSYIDLSHDLKLCFSHCSLFPENYTFYCQDLVQLWMAENFVSTEDLGTKIYKELIAKNILLTEPGYQGNPTRMHPIMLGLANYVSSRHFVKLQESCNTRHLYSVKKDFTVVPDIEQKHASRLRSLVLSKNPIKELPEGYLDRYCRLGVLDLRYTHVKKLPHSIGNMLQLRLINLSFTQLTELPESIRKLTNLQSLQLLGAINLERLPPGVTELTNLRCLTLGGNNASLRSLPPGIGQLKDLRRLDGFLVNEDVCNMEDLENLSLLIELTMRELNRVCSPERAQRGALWNKTKLTHLRLSCNPKYKPTKINMQQIFEQLCPPAKCVSIQIDGYSDKAFPSWMTTLPHDLEWFRLENCKFCEQLPPLGQLPRLKVLDIREIPFVTRIGSHFTGSLKFPLLEELYFFGMDRLQEWSGFEQDAFPCLKKLEIIRCHKLLELSSGMHQLTSLRELTISETKEIKHIKHFPSVRKLWIRRNESLEEVSDMAELNHMKIRMCSSIKQINGLTSLRHLEFSDHRMEFLPAWLTNMTSLKRLDLEVSKRLLQRLPEKKEFEKFQHIDQVEARCYTMNSQFVKKDSELYASYTKISHSFTTNLPHDFYVINAPSSSNVTS